MTVPTGSKPSTGIDATPNVDAVTVGPTSTYQTVSVGSVTITASNSIALAHCAVDSTVGILFRSTISTPSAYVHSGSGASAKGGWHYVQLISLGRTRVVSGTTQTLRVGGQTDGLDTCYPYEPAGVTPNVWDADTTERRADDGPAESLDTIASSYTINEHFNVYVMYMPPGSDSKFVPLRKYPWSWGGTATYASSVWTLSASSASCSSAVDYPAHPNWARLIDLVSGILTWSP